VLCELLDASGSANVELIGLLVEDPWCLLALHDFGTKEHLEASAQVWAGAECSSMREASEKALAKFEDVNYYWFIDAEALQKLSGPLKSNKRCCGWTACLDASQSVKTLHC